MCGDIQHNVDDSLFLDAGTGSLGWTNPCFRFLKGQNNTRMASGLRICLMDSDRPPIRGGSQSHVSHCSAEQPFQHTDKSASE